MQYAYTIFYVEDVETTIAFYEKAFGFSRKFVSPENDYGELQTGATTISFASISLGKANFKKGFTPIANNATAIGIEIALVSKNIIADFDRAVAAGASIYEPIQQKPWGQQVGYVRDNNGILIEICTPIKT